MWYGLDDRIYWHLIHTTLNYNQVQRYCWARHSTAHCCKHYCLQFVAVSTLCFLAMDFNTRTTTVSMNHTLQISLYYSTCKVFSLLPNLELSTELAQQLHHLPTAISRTLSPILCCSCQLSHSHLFSVIFAEQMMEAMYMWLVDWLKTFYFTGIDRLMHNWINRI
jgi:hypothetical protein